jgi:hypothetical protein
VNDKAPPRLPVVDLQTTEGDEPSCSPKIYVSNEEKAILGAMRTLRDRAVELRERLAEAGSADERRAIERELSELRSERSDLAIRREQAFKRKMIMLGHLPPDDEIQLF